MLRESSQPYAAPGVMPSRIRISGIAASLTIALHALLLTPMISTQFGGNRSGSAANSYSPALRPASVAASPLFLIPIHDAATAQQEPDPATALAALSLNESIESKWQATSNLPSLEVNSEINDTSLAPAIDVTATQRNEEMTYGQYLGEITSRIQRAWIMPVATKSQDFRCRVKIQPDSTGEIQEIAFEHCDSDVALQRSLLKAIQSSSPLPLQTIASGSGGAVTLEFSALNESGNTRITSVVPTVSKTE